MRDLKDPFKPAIGDMVRYVLSLEDGTQPPNVGHHRPAIIVRVWDDNCVQLQVFTDGPNDRSDRANVLWVTSVNHDQDQKAPRTWHWSE